MKTNDWGNKDISIADLLGEKVCLDVDRWLGTGIETKIVDVGREEFLLQEVVVAVEVVM